jgi:hypothetical protein
MKGQFDVSELELSLHRSLTPETTLLNPQWAVKTSEISLEKRGSAANVVQESLGLLESGRRFR